MDHLLGILRRNKWGVAGLLILAGGLVGGGFVPHDGPEAQTAAAGAGVVVAGGLLTLAAWAVKKFGPPPAGGAGA